MIVYAFYGCGKSTVCKENSDCYDHDFNDFYFETLDKYAGFNMNVILDAYISKAKELEETYPIVFINRYKPDIADLAVFQESYSSCIRTIAKRAQGNFMPAKQEYEDMVRAFTNKTDVLFLKEGEYLSDKLEEIRAYAREDKER